MAIRPRSPLPAGRRPGESRPLLTLLTPDEPGTPGGLDELLDEQAECWSRGETPGAEVFLGRLDPKAVQGDGPVALIYQEYCLAESAGQTPDPDAYLLRFPAHQDRLVRLFGLHEALGAGSAGADAEGPVDLPEAGDAVGPFRLLRELGRGGLARVFLAEQEDLDDRLVVVKVSTRASAEPRLLARARHPHIVEVLRHDRTADGALHLVCMPFLGGATLSAVLAGLRSRGGRPRSGRELLAELDRAGDPAYPAPRLGRPAREVLASSSYPKAVAWIVARLAEALDHAHGRGVAHGDLKPANILLTADGQPMLLDFNLAVDWGRAEAVGEGGGTLGYMAPERLRALAGRGPETPPRALDRHRADVYALGLILREMLGGYEPVGPVPGVGRSVRSQAEALAEVRSREPTLTGVTVGLRPLLSRCLAPDPADRYARAAELAEDLDRWRADLAPAFAGGKGWLSGLGRWTRRRRLAVLAGLLCVAVGALAAVAVTGAHRETFREQAEAKLEALWSHNEPGVYRYRNRWAVKAEGDQAELAGRLLSRYSVLDPDDWRDRPDVRYLPAEDREELEAWMMEQVWRFGSSLEARPNSPEDWGRALACLDRVSALIRLSPLETLHRVLRERLSMTEAPEPHGPPSPRWMNEYLQGVAAERLHAREALGHYRDVLAVRPNSYWANYRAAVASCRLEEFEVAADYLAQCLRRRPDNPAIRSLRASCLQSADRPGDALEECETALKLDPDYPDAYRTRLFVRKDLGQSVALRLDLDRCDLLVHQFDPAAASRLRLDVARILGLVPGVEEFRRSSEVSPDDLSMRYDLAYGLDAAGRWTEALAECDAILALDPNHLRTRFFRANLLKKHNDPEATREFASLLAHPQIEELFVTNGSSLRAFHHLANDHIARGEAREALAVAERGLAVAIRHGKMLGESHYAVARATAVAARTDPSLLGEVVHHLHEAATRNTKFLTDWLSKDHVFDDIRPTLLPALEARGWACWAEER